MSNATIIGRYHAGTSPLHRMDPRAKLLLDLALIATIFVVDPGNFIGLGVCAIFLAGFFKLSRIPFTTAAKSVAPLMFVVILTAFLNAFFTQGDTILFQWGFICISKEGLWQAVFMSCRLTLLLLSVSLLTLTTPTLDITEAFEYLLGPFSRIGVPAHELSMMMGIALRFLPQFSTELTTIYNAQVSRGAAFAKGRIALLVSLIVPLLTSAFRHAETLSLAMEARCYHGSVGRTRLWPLAYSRLDAAATGVIFVLLICVIVIRIVL